MQDRRYPEAEQALRKALQIWGAPQPADAAGAMNVLAVLYQSRHRNKQALETLERAAAIAPPGQPRARMPANLGGLCWRLGQKKQAVAWLAEALAEMERAVGCNHPDIARILDDSSEVLAKTGHRPEAKDLERRAQVILSSFAADANTGRKTVDWRDLKYTQRSTR